MIVPAGEGLRGAVGALRSSTRGEGTCGLILSVWSCAGRSSVKPVSNSRANGLERRHALWGCASRPPRRQAWELARRLVQGSVHFARIRSPLFIQTTAWGPWPKRATKGLHYTIL